ncbi:MAG: translation initiation factor IF-2, partial [Candidatus Micrarchaeia archaeon]
VAGSPVFVVSDSGERAKREVEKEISAVLFEKEIAGVILKADTLGSVEAIIKLLSDEKVPVSRAGIGAVVKKDVIDACGVRNQNRYYGVVLAFNTEVLGEAVEEARKLGITIISEGIIYSLLESYKKWVEEERKREQLEAFSSLVLPAEIKVLPGCCFRASKPAIFGVEVIAGRIKPGYEFMNENAVVVGKIKSIQKEKESIHEATEGMQVAVAMDEPVFGRHVNEGDILFSVIPKGDAKVLLEKYRGLLSDREAELICKIRGMLGDKFIKAV